MTKRRRFVTAHGRRIEVEEVAIPGLENGKQKPSSGQRFAMLTEERRKLLKGANGAAWAIYSYLLAVNWKNLRQPVKLTNMALTEIGVSKDAKSRALPQLRACWFDQGQKGRPTSADRHSPEIDCRENAKALSRKRESSVAKSRKLCRENAKALSRNRETGSLISLFISLSLSSILVVEDRLTSNQTLWKGGLQPWKRLGTSGTKCSIGK